MAVNKGAISGKTSSHQQASNRIVGSNRNKAAAIVSPEANSYESEYDEEYESESDNTSSQNKAAK